jgi:oxygen-independent coproporphyrinogen-3 oxidase
MHDFGLYVHIPFCQRKCPYCDFNTYAGLESRFDATVDALAGEMERWSSRLADREITTIFVGGGTPTVLGAQQLRRLFAAIRSAFNIAPDCEITCEANPGAVDRDKFGVLRDVGVNRLSMGVQSFQPDELSFLGRIHDVTDVYRAVEAAHEVGFDNLNLDFIFGLPHHRLDGWKDTLEQAIALHPSHLSLYSLIVEEETPLFRWVETGKVDPPDDDVAANLYEVAMKRLDAAGFVQYEVSNWALPAANDDVNSTPAMASRHNLIYWRNGEFVGIGPGAHSHLRDSDGRSLRWANLKFVATYNSAVRNGRSVEAFNERIDERTSMGETMMLGMRLVREGVPFDRFYALHRRDLRQFYEHEILELEQLGLVVVDSERIRLTERGLMLGNQVFARFVAEPALAA